MVRFHLIGKFSPGQVIAREVPSTRLIRPDIEQSIDRAWADAQRRPNVQLFDGPMCRLEFWAVQGGSLTLSWSKTSYRPLFGTNLSHPELAKDYGSSALANALGVSAALETADGYLMLGKRNDRVAYYPGRVHPFAGCLEPQDEIDVFAEVRRELCEELGLSDSDIVDSQCVGLAEDAMIRQPELIFAVSTSRTRKQIQEQLDPAEHAATWPVAATPQAVATALREPLLTPVAMAMLLLWGRLRFGEAWFIEHSDAIGRSPDD